MKSVLDILYHAFLPGLSIVLGAIGFWALGMRSLMVNVLGEDYILYAESKGLQAAAGSSSATGCATRSCPRSPRLALALGTIVSGAVLVEAIFNYPGLGGLLFGSILGQGHLRHQRDRPGPDRDPGRRRLRDRPDDPHPGPEDPTPTHDDQSPPPSPPSRPRDRAAGIRFLSDPRITRQLIVGLTDAARRSSPLRSSGRSSSIPSRPTSARRRRVCRRTSSTSSGTDTQGRDLWTVMALGTRQHAQDRPHRRFGRASASGSSWRSSPASSAVCRTRSSGSSPTRC